MSRLYSAGALNCMYPGKASHRALASLYQCPYVPIRTWVSGTTPMVKMLSDMSGKKIFLSFSFAQKTFKNMNASVT
jgi:hypothetical protein